ncbi:MAG TPA: hypothetical protein VNQ57_02255 [Ureibacillus sp.]|nr:hypothetical protein [Ureibacillus sp.]
MEKRNDYEGFKASELQNGESAENNLKSSLEVPFDNIEDALKWIDEGEPDLD